MIDQGLSCFLYSCLLHYNRMIWITPPVLTGEVPQIFDRSSDASKRSSVNVLEKVRHCSRNSWIEYAVRRTNSNSVYLFLRWLNISGMGNGVGEDCGKRFEGQTGPERKYHFNREENEVIEK